MTHYESKITPCMAWLEFDGYTKQFRDYIEEIVFGEYVATCGIHSVEKCCLDGSISYEDTEEVINENLLDKIVKRENFRPDNYYKAIWYAYGRTDSPICSPFDIWDFNEEEDIIAQALFKNLWDTCKILFSTLQTEKEIVSVICPIIDKTVETIQRILGVLTDK